MGAIEEAGARIRAVLRAWSTPDPLDDLLAHRRAVELGPAVLPNIRDTILRADWSSIKPKGKLGAFTALMLVAHDVDESAARQIGQDLVSRGSCHPVFLKRLETITRFSLDDFYRFDAGELKVFISKSLTGAARRWALLETWLSTIPPADIVGIPRLFVVDRTQDDYWGLYLRILATVTLVWREEFSPTFRNRLATEFTLYHEIGHHVDAREDPMASQERIVSEQRADAYALKKFGEAHPLIGRGFIGLVTVAFALGRPPHLPGSDD